MRSILVLGALIACGCGARDETRAPSEEAPMGEIRERHVSVSGADIHLLEAGRVTDPCILLLHGAAFQARTWLDLGTLEALAHASFHPIAIDLPGYGESPESTLAPADFLIDLYAALDLDRAVIVSPSMSGAFSLPFVARHPERVAGYVPVAPAGIAQHVPALTGSKVPTLVLWGGADTVFPPTQSSELAAAFEEAEAVIFENARHPCYLDDPARFHELLSSFMKRVQAR